MNETEKLKNLVLAPYIIKATALIGKQRYVGGNQFRHALATMAILMDYKYFDDPVLLKASVVHDLFEDVPEADEQELRKIDNDGNDVVDLVLEVTRTDDVPKEDYLKKILETGSVKSKILKVADRISNLTDLHRDQYPRKEMSDYLDQTEKYVLPMAAIVNKDMERELKDLIEKRRRQLNLFNFPGVFGI
jgi:(p)ppGpp synthase/HD superfamily hydrolase